MSWTTIFYGSFKEVSNDKMKFNISFPATGCQNLTEAGDEHNLHSFYELYMPVEVVILCEKNGRVM